MAASVLDGKSAVSVSGNVSAGSTPSNFTIQGSPADVANYARQGNDLVVQMKNGQSFTIQNFSAQGASFNNLVFAQGETVSVVNFSRAFSALGDGIIDSLVTTQVVGAGVSTTALLGILGAAAAAGGVAVVVSENKDEPTDPVNPVDPTDPTNPTNPLDPTNPTDPTGPVDTTPPAAPTGLSLSHDTGASDTDSITNIGAQTFSGKAEAGSTVEVTISGAQFGTRVIGTVKADAAGNWSITSTVELPDGNYAVTAKATDAAGNVSPVSEPLEFVLDTAVNAPTDISILDSDGLVLGSLTNVNHIKFSGQAERGSVVTLVLDGDTIGTATVDADGIWTFDYTAQTVLDGQYTLEAKATDVAGNVSQGAIYKFEVDTVIAAPTAIGIKDSDGVTLNALTNVNALMFSGQAEADSIVELFLGGASIGTATAGADGVWKFDYTGTTVLDGEYTLVAVATDRAGNISTNGSYSFEIDTITQTPGGIGAADSNGGQVMNGTTLMRELKFSGMAEANSEVELFLNGSRIGYTSVAADGTWSFDHTGTTLNFGDYELTVKATDLAGNVSMLGSYEFEVEAPTFGVSVAVTNHFTGSYITFTFNEPVLRSSLDLSGIIVKNGALVSGAQPQWSSDNTEFTIEVTPELGWANTNVAATLLKGSVSSELGEVNAEGKNNTSLDNLFNNSSNLSAGDITGWDTSHAISAKGTFRGNATFNQDIGGWDVSHVKSMENMFSFTQVFNQDIGDWDVSSVESFAHMFNQAVAFNQDLNNWDTSSVTTAMAMFQNNFIFNGNISAWDMSSLQDASFMFSSTRVFNSDISGWNTGSVTNMEYMFQGAQAFDRNLGGWDISSLTSAKDMFSNGAGISVGNMNLTLRGWAKSAMIGNAPDNIDWGVSTYSDATAAEYLRVEHGWTIATNKVENSIGVRVGTAGADTMFAFPGTNSVMHGLGGDDTITGSTGNDWIVGGEGNDILTGGAGADTFHYGFKNAGSDMITDFNTTEGDVIHLADLLVGYNPATSTLSNFITAEDNTFGGTLLKVHYDGSGAATDLVEIELSNVTYTSNLLNDLIAGNNLVLA